MTEEQKPLERQLTDEERKKYDRAGFIGHQVQKRLLASNILIKGMNGSNSELAKNLILAGANITIVDDQLITERDTDTNFLFTKDMIGQKRAEEAQKELILINPLVKIQLLEQFPENENLKQYNAIVTSTTDFDEMSKYDQLSQTFNIPYYNLVCCGYYGFMYIGLGNRFIYEREKKVVLQIVFGKKLQDQDRYQEFEEVIATSVPLEQTFDYNFQSRTFEIDLVYYCILMMKKVNSIPELKAFDPFNPNQDLLNQIVEIGKDIFKTATGKDANEDQINTFQKFAQFYGIDYCPVYSIIGSVASQELIISTSRINEPALNWFCFNSQSCLGQVEVIQDTSKFPVRDLPERKKLIPKE